jgi:hypothetical protein
VDLKEIGCECVNWIHIAQPRVQYRPVSHFASVLLTSL